MMTSKYLSKYEKTLVIGTRALQISQNSPTLIENETEPYKIALEELKQKKCPIIIRRYLTKEVFEDIPVNNLKIL